LKLITIYQENNTPFTIEDEDNSNLEDFSRKIATLLESGNVSILHTSSGSIVVRPNKISSIFVCEIIDDLPDKQSKEMGSIKVKEPEKIEEHEDFITD